MASRSRRSAATVPLDQRLLFGDVDGDADQVETAVAFLMGKFAARAQPDPASVGMAHAEFMIDRLQLGVGDLGGEAVEIDVVAVHQRVDLAESEQIVLRLKAEDVEHRVRPEHPAARQIPVPKPAAAAVERGVDAAAHSVVDQIGLAGAGCLPVEGKAEDQHHETGGGGEGDGQRGGRAPVGQCLAARLHDREEADRIAQRPHRGESVVAVRHDVLAGAGVVAEWLRRAEHVEDMPAEHERLVRHAGDDHAVGVGDQDAAAGARGPGRQRRFSACDVRGSAGLPSRAARSMVRQMIGEGFAGAYESRMA